jgi:NitT/TauT family transport system ATP-binding protein
VTYSKEFSDIVQELRGHIGAIRNTGVAQAAAAQATADKAGAA